MPSKSPAQKRLMDAIDHGWHPSKFKGPSKRVAHEFVEADRKKKLDRWAKSKIRQEVV